MFLALPLAGQANPASIGAAAIRLRTTLTTQGPPFGAAIWPGFRPDTIPWLVRYPSGTLLLGWPGERPDGMDPVPGVPGGYWRPTADAAAANTSVQLDGRGVAQFAAADLRGPALLGLAVHEAFHVFERATARGDRRFGQGENSFLVTRYPIFDPENEAGVFLELALLSDALASRSHDSTAQIVRRWVAVREERQRALDADLVEFEAMAEMNEGLAEYALTRARYPDTAAATTSIRERLARLPDETDRSIRLRFYVTGSAMGLLLDRLGGAGWKARLVAENLTLQDALAEASGAREAARRLVAEARERHAGQRLAERAATGVRDLAALRSRQADSILATPGLLLDVGTRSGSIGMCGIDPQNLLQVSPGRLLHTRWVHLCAGRRMDGEFLAPVVEDRQAGTWRAVVGTVAEVRFAAGGTPVVPDASERELEELDVTAPGARFHFGPVAIRREGRTVTIRLR